MSRTDNNFAPNIRRSATRSVLTPDMAKEFVKIKVAKRMCQREGCDKVIPAFKNNSTKYCSDYCRGKVHSDKSMSDKLEKLGREKIWRGERRIGLYKFHRN